jgi:large subunit ribosomal protein L20
MRVKRGVAARRRHKKIRKLAKGYRGRNRTTIKTAKQAVMKAGLHAYRDRKLRKRTFRSLWIVRLNAALRARGTTYSKFVHQMSQKGVLLNRKALAELAVNGPEAFDALVTKVLGSEKISVGASSGKRFAAPEKKAYVKKPAAERPEEKHARQSTKGEGGKVAKKPAPARKPAVKKKTAKKKAPPKKAKA